MHFKDALQLIGKGISVSPQAQQWADLGAGSGLFTVALATGLPDGSHIVAVDADQHAMRAIPKEYKNEHKQVSIETVALDFVTEPLQVESLDGILMANALHYVQEKAAFIDKLLKSLSPEGRLVIVEYETSSANTWVPYPITYHSLSVLLHDQGFSSVRRIGEQPSLYHRGGMYAALALR